LVALIMSLLVMFPTSSMQKSEEDLLNWVDEYCNENLLRRLDDGGGRIGALTGGSGDVARAIDAALAAQRVELERWNKTFKSIGSMLTEDVVKGWAKITEQMAQQQSAREAQIKELDRTIEEFQKSMAALTAETTKAGDRIAQPLGERFAELQRGLEGLNENLQRLSDKEVVVQTVPKRRWGWFSRSRDGR
jgi:DNA anti-recombination protein RmuC